MNFKDYIFLKERAYTEGLTPDVEDYINKKFEDIESKLTALTSDGNRYNVIPSGDGLLDIIDIDKQTVEGKLSYQGELISSPVVHDNKVSFAIQKSSGDNKREVLGVIYELPTGNNVGTFRVEEPSDKEYQKLMGIKEPGDSEEIEDVESNLNSTLDDLETKLSTAKKERDDALKALDDKLGVRDAGQDNKISDLETSLKQYAKDVSAKDIEAAQAERDKDLDDRRQREKDLDDLEGRKVLEPESPESVFDKEDDERPIRPLSLRPKT